MCHAHSISIDESEAFADKIMNALNGGALAVMISLGHRSGLFEALSRTENATSAELAALSKLNERYVREWLGAMACAGIVEVDSSGKLFTLPAERRPLLTKAGGSDNMAGFMQYVGMFGQVEDGILNCFKHGGGLRYAEFERFHEIMAEDSGQSTLSSLFDVILPIVPGIEARLRQGTNVLDLGCGRGKALLAMAKQFPSSRFTGFDLCEPPLAEARAEAKTLGLTNVVFEQLDASKLNQDFEPGAVARFDFITTFDAIHDQAHPDVVLKNIYAALKPGGHYLMQDIDASSNVNNNLSHPMGTFLYTVSTMHCMSVSLADNGLGLGAMWGREKARELLGQAGFSGVIEHTLPHDPQNRYYVMSK